MRGNETSLSLKKREVKVETCLLDVSMKKKLKLYSDYINNVIQSSSKYTLDDIQHFLRLHLKRIEFYQHERLIHFLVTLLISILAFLSFVLFVITSNVLVLILLGLFVALLIPYIFYYYFLENYVQSLYTQYFKLDKIVCDMQSADN